MCCRGPKPSTTWPGTREREERHCLQRQRKPRPLTAARPHFVGLQDSGLMPDGSINPASTADKLEAFGLDAMLNCWSPLVHATKVGAPLHTEWTQECSQSVHSSSQPAPFAASPSCSAGASLSVAAPSDRCPAITIFPPRSLAVSRCRLRRRSSSAEQVCPARRTAACASSRRRTSSGRSSTWRSAPTSRTGPTAPTRRCRAHLVIICFKTHTHTHRAVALF